MTESLQEEPMVFVIDDEYYIRDSLALLINSRRLSYALFDSAESFLESLSLYHPLTVATVLLDVRMSRLSGVKLFQRLRDQEAVWPVIFLTGHGHVKMAVEAMKSGAFDFIEKPFNNNRLVDVVLEALDECRNRIHRFKIKSKILRIINNFDPKTRKVFYDFVERGLQSDGLFPLNEKEEHLLGLFGVSSLIDFYHLLDAGNVRIDKL